MTYCRKIGSIVVDIAVSTYTPQSPWKSKIDPEHDKFLRSFKCFKEFDLSSQKP